MKALDWSKSNDFQFGSAGENGFMCIWDKRTGMPGHKVNAHQERATGLKFNPKDEHIVATCGSDALVKIWDTRILKEATNELKWHQHEVNRIAWAPFSKDVLATGGFDRRVAVWDLKKTGAKLTAEEALDGPPELLFVHGGHTAPIAGIDWNPLQEHAWLNLSAASNGRVHLWQMSGETQEYGCCCHAKENEPGI